MTSALSDGRVNAGKLKEFSTQVWKLYTVSIEEALPIILRRANFPVWAPRNSEENVGLWTSTKWLDIFECMVRIDDAAAAESLSDTNPLLDSWALQNPRTLVEALRRENGRMLLAVLLVVSPRALGNLSSHLPLTYWMEAARAVNRVSVEQFRALTDTSALGEYLAGRSRHAPRVDLPTVFPLPAPSMLRVVQSMKFRFGLTGDEGYREAMRRYIRFYC